jgi:hypothetical protein
VDAFIAFFKLIPSFVWASLITLIITWGAVFITNKHNNKIILKQLHHDSDQRDRERDMKLRCEVYLPAIEAIRASHTALVRIADQNISNSELSSKFQESSASISRIELIGSEKTLKAVTDFSQSIGIHFFSLYPKRLPLTLSNNRIAQLREIEGNLAKEYDKFEQIIKRLHLEASEDKRLVGTIMEYLTFYKGRIENCNAERNELAQSNYTNSIELIKQCIHAMTEVGKLIGPAIKAMREEMELPLDIDEYNKIMAKQHEAIKIHFDHFIEQLPKKLNG